MKTPCRKKRGVPLVKGCQGGIKKPQLEPDWKVRSGEPAGWKACPTLIDTESRVLNFGIQRSGLNPNRKGGTFHHFKPWEDESG
jgi:hypothetical protein